MRGLKKFGEQGHQVTYKEMKPLHERIIFELINVNNLTQLKRGQAMESLIILNKK
jgi:hypothetical protein